MNQDRKYCVDCTHFENHSAAGAACTHPDHNLDFVYGEPRAALAARAPHGFCKPYALGFEPKKVVEPERAPSLWERLFGREDQ